MKFKKKLLQIKLSESMSADSIQVFIKNVYDNKFNLISLN